MLVLHVGYAKAATTFLQKRVFPVFPGINYMGRFYGEDLAGSKRADWVYDFAFKDKISLESVADSIYDGIDDRAAPNLISHEALLRPYYTYRTIQRMSNLSAYFGEIRLIVSIRNQADIILSRSVHDRGIVEYGSIADALDFEGITQCKWPQCSRRGRLSSLIGKSECPCRVAGVKFINVQFYNYLNLLCLLRSVFGGENVHFLPSEALQDNYAHEIERLARFLGVSSTGDLDLQGLAGKRENKRQSNPFYDKCQEEFLASGKRREVFEYFRESNSTLSEVLQLDLEKYGYY